MFPTPPTDLVSILWMIGALVLGYWLRSRGINIPLPLWPPTPDRPMPPYVASTSDEASQAVASAASCAQSACAKAYNATRDKLLEELRTRVPPLG